MNLELQYGGIDPPSEQNFRLHDFDAVQSAVLETDRGRWFLSEFSRRQRTSESSEILTALDRLTRRVVACECGLGQMLKGRSAPVDIAVNAIASEAAELPDSPKPRPDLGERLTALREIDALDVEAKVRLFA